MNCEVSNAMEGAISPFEWNRRALEGRALLGPAVEVEPPEPLISPVPPKHVKTNYSLVAALTVLMVVAVFAIFCCCYQWEERLRGHSRSQSSPGPSELVEGTRSSSSSLQESVGPSISVIMPGDDIPRFVAWTAPQGVPVAAPTTGDARVPPELNQHIEKNGLSAARNSWIPSRVSG